MIRPIDWVQPEDGSAGYIRLLDQTALPETERLIEVRDIDTLIDAITRLAVRGAPALGVAGAMGIALAVQNLPADEVPSAAQRIGEARPTAVNLTWGVRRAMHAVPDGFDAVLALALQIRDDDIASSTAIARRGADELYATLGKDRTNAGLRIMTICNTGALAAVERGTALAVIEEVFRDGNLQRAYPCETRPLLQGSRLTAWELTQMGAPFDLIVDSAAASTMQRGMVDAVIAGADRIAANGDSANKIGTFSLAVAAKHLQIPFYIAAPESTIDLATASGADIEIEDRGPAEIGEFHGVRTAPKGTSALNPAFDVTPAELITGIITDTRVIHPADGDRPDDTQHGSTEQNRHPAEEGAQR